MILAKITFSRPLSVSTSPLLVSCAVLRDSLTGLVLIVLIVLILDVLHELLSARLSTFWRSAIALLLVLAHVPFLVRLPLAMLFHPVWVRSFPLWVRSSWVFSPAVGPLFPAVGPLFRQLYVGSSVLLRLSSTIRLIGTSCGLLFWFHLRFLGVASHSRRALFRHVSRHATLLYELCPLNASVSLRDRRTHTVFAA